MIDLHLLKNNIQTKSVCHGNIKDSQQAKQNAPRHTPASQPLAGFLNITQVGPAIVAGELASRYHKLSLFQSSRKVVYREALPAPQIGAAEPGREKM